jgi:hypothetical protein
MKVLLNRRFELIFSAKAFEMLGKPAAVKLMFDVGQSQIGVMAEDPYSDAAFDMIKRQNGSSRYIPARGFCYQFLIQVEETVAFNNIRMEESVMILDLNSSTRVENKRLAADAEEPVPEPA